MAKKMFKETKKLTHKFEAEGVISINGDNTIEIDIPEEGIKKFNDLIKNFSGNYVKVSITEEDMEEII